MEHCDIQQRRARAGVLAGTKVFDPKPEPPRAENWITPAQVLSASGEPYPCPEDPGRYAAEKTIDKDPRTFCCLLDDTRGGSDESTIPPNAAAPVTGHILYDLGREIPVAGARITAKPTDGVYNPKDVVFSSASAAAEIAADRENLVSASLPPIRSGARHTVRWEPKPARYIVLEVLSSYESQRTNFNFQLAEIEFLIVK